MITHIDDETYTDKAEVSFPTPISNSTESLIIKQNSQYQQAEKHHMSQIA